MSYRSASDNKDNKQNVSVTPANRRFFTRSLIGLTLITLLSGWGGIEAARHWLPKAAVNAVALIPIGFWLWELLVIWLISQTQTDRNTRMRLFLKLKAVKTVFFILAIALYRIAVGLDTKYFAVTLMAYFVIYLVFETVAYGKLEKISKKEENK